MLHTALEWNALAFASTKHGTQKRKYTGEPYVNHLIAVGRMVKDHGGTPTMVAAALLHDVLEDTNASVNELINKFGEPVAKLVIELTDVFVAGSGGNRALRKELEALRLGDASAEAQTIKVADLIDNTKSITAHDPAFAKIYLKEKAALLKVLTKANPTLLRKAKTTLMAKGTAAGFK